MPKASLNRHQKCANYGPLIDIPAAGLLCLPVLEKRLFTQYVPSQLPQPHLGP